MTETTKEHDELYRSFVRDRRRERIAFITVFCIVVLSLGVGWTLSAIRSEQQSRSLSSLLDQYTQLYGEFTQKTGKEPDAKAPDQVPVKGDPGDQGLPGPVGPAGPSGKDSIVPGPQGLPGIAGLDGRDGAPGVAGADGSSGRDGQDGAPGAPGKDGQNGAPGAPGPTCPADWTPSTVWIPISDTENGPTTERQAIVCLPLIVPTPTP